MRFIPGLFVVVVLSMVCLASHQANAQLIRTGWSSITSASSGKCIDIGGASGQSGAAAIQWPCNFNANEQWNLQPSGGAFHIIEQQTQLCLTVAGSAIVQSACSGNASLWTIAAAGGAYKLVSRANNLCLTAYANGTGDGDAMAQGSCQDPNLTPWVFHNGLVTASELVTLQADHSGQCMVIAAGGAGSGIVQDPCTGTAAEQWSIAPAGSAYVVTSGSNGLCLGSASGAVAGAPLTQSPCSGSANQAFSFQTVNGAYFLVSAANQLCVDVSGGSLAAGSPVVLAACTSTGHDQWSVSAATLRASWTNVLPLNTDPIAVANLPNGQLLTWSAYDTFTFEGDIGKGNGQTYYSVFNPQTLSSGLAKVTTTGSDMFCPGIANLFDGRVLVNGGSSSPKTTIYDPATGLFSADALMNVPRGYQGDAQLSTGSVLTLGGSWSGGSGGKTGEIWTNGRGWALLGGVPETPIVGPDPKGIYRGDNHLWLFAQSNGTVFQAGPSAQMNWITTAGQGSITSAGNRGDDGFSINGNAVLYDVGKILKAGGGPAYDSGNATTSAYVINIAKGVAVTKIAPMAYARSFSSGVALPTGQVLIVGGQTLPKPFTDTGAILVPELWDPLTNAFKQLAPMQTPRTYHSTAILLNDGRVFVGGGGQCGSGCTANHFNTEILTPPYLLNADGSAAIRPSITSVPATAALGSTISVSTNAAVVSFALMRNSSITHTVNNEQRRIPLSIQSGTNTTYKLAIPSDPGVVLPGYYMLFGLNVQGVPSVAATILVH